ncbi:hypothetical protein HPG69_002921, partial [Diceros bicornis minor]
DETDEETDEERGPEAEDVWVVESLCGLKMRLKRQRVSTVLPEHHEAFTRLLEDPVIKKFLAWDRDLLLSDKNRAKRPLFHKLRFQFIRSTGWRMRVSREECEEVGGLWEFALCEGQGLTAERGDHGGMESRLLIRSSGCGGEIALSCPRDPGTMEA